jgi:4-hydroxythreonine-4-phosphate dehydrogenase
MMTPLAPPRIAISLGDPSGIGAEVTAAALARCRGELAPIVYGDLSLFLRWFGESGLSLVPRGGSLPRGGALVPVTELAPRDARAGKPTPAGAGAQLAYLEWAFDAVERGAADALCTAPVSKAQVARVSPGFVGHTEWLEERAARFRGRGLRPAGRASSGAHPGTAGARSVMMLAGERLRVALVTNHVALGRLRRLLTPARIAGTIEIVYRALRADFRIARPRVALAALNPHAGEEGAFGDEERTLLAPALALAARRRCKAAGPFPADSVFFRAALGEFDAVVALYHDQGLIPVKLLDALMGDAAVNVTLGLPVVRTSPDHGVAYDIAGKGKASPASMIAAIRLATRIARARARRG